LITLYRNARLIDASGDRYGDLCTQDGIITSCAPLCCSGRQGDRHAANALMPAFIDLHCHLRDPGYPKKKPWRRVCARRSMRYAHLTAMANTDPVMNTPALSPQTTKSDRLHLCARLRKPPPRAKHWATRLPPIAKA
jgi:dihydroorotase